MTHVQYHLRGQQIEFNGKFWESALHPNWMIMLTNLSNFVFNEQTSKVL